MQYIIRIRIVERTGWPTEAWFDVLERMGVRFHDRGGETVNPTWKKQCP